jgi:hypothetical protein
MARLKVKSSALARQATELYQPGAPLHALAPGALAHLTPAQRAQKLKRSKKGLLPSSPLTNPAAALGS